MKADFLARFFGGRRLQQTANGLEQCRDGFVLSVHTLFQLRELPGEFAVGRQLFAKINEGTYDANTRFYRNRTA